MMEKINSFQQLWQSFYKMMSTYQYQEYKPAIREKGVITDGGWFDIEKVVGCLLQTTGDQKSTDQLIKNGEATHTFVSKNKLKKEGRIIDKQQNRIFQIIEANYVADITGFNKYYLKETNYVN